MLWLLIPMLTVLAVCSYLLFAPLYLQINSLNNFYGIRFHRIAYAQLLIADSSLIVSLWVAGWQKQFDLLAMSAKRRQKRVQRKSRTKNKSAKGSFSRIKALVQSFSVTRCHLSVDLGDVEVNGVLYPAFYWLGRYTNRPVGINFSGKTEIDIELKNRIARLAIALISSSIHIF